MRTHEIPYACSWLRPLDRSKTHGCTVAGCAICVHLSCGQLHASPWFLSSLSLMRRPDIKGNGQRKKTKSAGNGRVSSRFHSRVKSRREKDTIRSRTSVIVDETYDRRNTVEQCRLILCFPEERSVFSQRTTLFRVARINIASIRITVEKTEHSVLAIYPTIQTNDNVSRFLRVIFIFCCPYLPRDR